MEHTLVLNASYEPVNVVNWKRALTLLYQGKVEVLAEYDREIHSISITVKLPSVLRLLKFARVKRRSQHIKFCRENIYARDHFTCQYCGKRQAADSLTFDHVIPVVKGGARSWDNIVTCCIPCNNRKGGRTPSEAGMHLIRTPGEPEWAPATLHIAVGLRKAPSSWYDYLKLDVHLDSHS